MNITKHIFHSTALIPVLAWFWYLPHNVSDPFVLIVQLGMVMCLTLVGFGGLFSLVEALLTAPIPEPDDLSSARGILNGIGISLLLWSGIIFVGLAILR